ncbi:hypothetical protein J421_5542 (plasmid) [Gemmatirosa kalamazoonensis]|uniref:Uncharacterized protein n=2 Tax=Gemmatirosa kalamazoonensis TaxID=861299 RepID=W0RRI4_9BACT|nr:hypothetical protein J421_5542 [Gemmatirosa kalamazoonensis]
MPPRNERIAAMVRGELAKNPNVGNDALLEKARAIDPKVRRLSPRQFHATYRLPALRAGAPKKAESKPAESRRPESGAPDGTADAGAAAPRPSAAPASAAPASAAPASASKALARPHAPEREAVRAILQTVAREALGTEDRASFVRLLDSLDERAATILSIFGRT